MKTPKSYNLTKLIEIVEPLDEDEWIFMESNEKRNRVLEIASEVNGHVWEMPHPESALKALREYGYVYTSDMNHYTNRGHQYFADQITSLLRRRGGDEIRLVRSNVLGPWRDRDLCHQWYENGEIPLWYEAPFRRGLHTSDRFALEFRNASTDTIHVRNPFSDRRINLWIDFMAGYPEKVYPRSRIDLLDPEENSSSSERRRSVVLNPLLETNVPGLEVHVMHHAFIGVLEMGEHRLLRVEALMNETKEPFQIVGVAYTTVDVAEKRFIERFDNVDGEEAQKNWSGVKEENPPIESSNRSSTE